METRWPFVILFFYATNVVANELSSKDYYHPNEDTESLCRGLFTKVSALMMEIDKVNQNLLDLNNRQNDQAYPMENSCHSDPTWISILRRQDGSVNFTRSWNEYKAGFGDRPNGEFFIGLEVIHLITRGGPYELLVVLVDWNNEMRYAQYDHFKIGGEDEKYAINVLGSYTGDAGDSLEYHIGMQFTTFDQDNDKSRGNCAKQYEGAWWFKNFYHSHLNGPYKKESESNQAGVSWNGWKGSDYSFKFAEMKIRPKAL